MQAPHSTLSRLANGLHEVNIYGFFPHPHWMVFLLSGLADLKISVISGRAQQDNFQKWDAAFRLDFKNSAFAPGSIDYVALAQTKPQVSHSTQPRVTAYRVARKLNASIELHLEGPDQIGFLGRLLSEVSLLALFPVDMEVNTIANQIQDRIVFRGFGGMAPGAHIDGSLETLLNNLVKAS